MKIGYFSWLPFTAGIGGAIIFLVILDVLPFWIVPAVAILILLLAAVLEGLAPIYYDMLPRAFMPAAGLAMLLAGYTAWQIWNLPAGYLGFAAASLCCGITAAITTNIRCGKLEHSYANKSP